MVPFLGTAPTRSLKVEVRMRLVPLVIVELLSEYGNDTIPSVSKTDVLPLLAFDVNLWLGL